MATKKKTTTKKKPQSENLTKIDFAEDVKVGSTVTVNSEHYTVLEGKKLKSKTTGKEFSY